MTVYRDDERGTYYFVVRVPWKDGTKQMKRRGFRLKRDALVAEAELVLKYEKIKESETVDDPPFYVLAESYLEWYKRRRKKSSFNKTDSIIRIHLLPRFNDIRIEKIKARDVTSFQDDLLDANLSTNHIKKIHQVLSAVFNFGIKEEITVRNPARLAGNIDIEEDKHINYWVLDEFKEFISHVDEQMYYVLFMTLYYSGMRKGELLALTWSDINFNNNTINIDKTAYNRDVTPTKTAASRRRVIMPKHVMRLLDSLKTDIKPKMNYVVFGEFKDHIATSTLDRRYDDYILASGVNRIRLHDFRHSHASYLINKNTVITVVAKRLGHKDVATTLNTYSHLYPTTENEAVLDMEDDFKTADIIDFKIN